MVDYSTLTELELYRDAQTGEFIARDPDTSTEYAVPFEELNAGTATADTANIGSANIDSLGQGVNANGNDISNVGAFDSNSVNTDRLSIEDSGAVDHGTLASGSSNSVNVSFSTDFDSPPIVIHSVGRNEFGTSLDLNIAATDITTSEFVSRIENVGDGNAAPRDCGWIALV